jgi:hypothetical protein
VERLARNRQELEEIQPRLAAMSLPDLIRLASEKGEGLLQVVARRVVTARTGKTWKNLHKALIAQEQGAKQKEMAARRAEYEKLSIAELHGLLTTEGAEFNLVWQVLKKKQRKLQEDERRSRAAKSAHVVRPKPGRESAETEGDLGADYLKPMSKEYGMPEYDLE